jgi:hypothetical protein
VAAELIVRLFEANLLPKTPQTIQRAAIAVGVPIDVIRRAWAGDGRHAQLDTTLVATGDDLPPTASPSPSPAGNSTADEVENPAPQADPEPRYAPNYNGNTRAANEKRRAAKEPVAGKRLCNRCGELKGKSEFNISKPRTGKLRPECKACNRIYQRERRLTSEQLEKLGPVLRFILKDGDEHAGMVCPDCRQPCRIGDEVVASDAVLRHAAHRGPN